MSRRRIQIPNDSARILAVSEINRAAPFLLRYVTPLYIADEKGHPHLGASGTLLSAGIRHFIVTAAHSTDALEYSELYAMGTASHRTVQLRGTMVTSVAPINGGRKRDRIDIGVIEMTPEEVLEFDPKSFWPMESVDLNDSGKNGTTYLVAGYPSQINRSVDLTAGTLSPCAALHLTQIREPSPLQKLSLSSETHIFVRFKKSKVFINGRKSTAPDPYGMSGGPLWRFDMGRPDPWKLVGIVTEWNQQFAGFLILRIKATLDAIKLVYPEFSGLIRVR